jgi:molecular chaperone DnaK (HSP70)
MTDARELVVGIDLGTTNSLVARLSAGQPNILDYEGRALTMPSVVSYLPDGGTLVGEDAVERAPLAPAETVFSVKRLMGQGLSDLTPAVRSHFAVELVEKQRKLVEVQIGEARYTPQEVSARVLAELKRRAEAALGQQVVKAVVTVPAYFDDAQRQATRDAGKIAGLQVLRIINEPTAASLAYGLGGKDVDQTIAVYDLGGGTFDLSLLRVQAGTFRVLATHGDTFLGGDDIDRLLIEVARETLAGAGIATDDPRLRAQLRQAAEQAKIALSSAEETVLRLQDPSRGINLELALQRSDLEKLMAPLVDRSLELCQLALRQAGLKPGDVDEVVMVGGSTRIPYVRQRVGELFGRTPHTDLDPDQVVALGAAVQADILAGGESEVLLLDVIPLSLGIETFGGAVNKLIMANTAIPTQATEEFTTPKDNVTAFDLHVLQGERELVKDCRSLARFKLKIPPMPAGYPKMKVTFLIDADGILRVMAYEERSGAEAEIEVTPVHGLTEDEVDAIMADSIQHAMADIKNHQLIDLRNESATVIRAARKTLKQAGHELTDAHREAIVRLSDELEQLCAADDVPPLKQTLEALNDACEPLATAVLNQVVRGNLQGKKLDEIEVQ